MNTPAAACTLMIAVFAAGCGPGKSAGGDAAITGAVHDGPTAGIDGGGGNDSQGPADWDGGGAGAACSADLPCAGGLFCDIPPRNGLCGGSYMTGTCLAGPTPCPSGGMAVCGCDGKTYPNDCLRRNARVPLASGGACTPWPAETTPCGDTNCTPTQVCVHPGSGCGIPPRCEPRPEGGTCPAGQVTCNLPGNQPGCANDCSPPPAYCLDIPASCRELPTCACLQPHCACVGISQRRQVVCGSAP